jgi:hypothetical protein
MNPQVQRAIAKRLKPRMDKLGLTLDSVLGELKRLVFVRTGVEDMDGALLPIEDWPAGIRPYVMQVLGQKQQAIAQTMKYLKHTAAFGPPPSEQPSGPALQVNNFTVVPVERLTDEELAFYAQLARKGRAVPIEGQAVPEPSK